MNHMKSMLAVSVAFAAAIAVPATVHARPQTTTPGVIYVIKTTVDDKGIHIPKDKFTRNGVTRYPRGALIRYEFTNKGTKPYAVRIWASSTLVMKPGQKQARLVNWAYRGDYTYARIYKGHQISPIGTIIIF
ncbi:MAG: hypothetical protein QOD52_1838 [Gaiellaceae bacterium]|jgi:hypothetical protein|nr:hypothetical protein [Gaiellaceae bacterium]